MKLIDDFLNNITMYRLVLYYLLVLIFSAVVLSFFNLLPFSYISLICSTAFLVAVGWSTNRIFAFVFKVPTNVESIYISALILALIITPVISIKGLPVLFWAAVFVAASKFIFAINKKHIFNPAAFSVLVISLASIGSASWWVGTMVMMPAVLIGGLLIVKKIRRFSLVLSYFTIALFSILAFALTDGRDLLTLMGQIFLDSPILFFAFVMLSEPQTTPPSTRMQVLYGGLVGFLFAPQLRLGSFATTPESALILGNLFSYIVSPKQKLILKLKQTIQLAPNIYDFVFSLNEKFNFIPGQYMEWTLAQKNPDSRGSRRYLTIAASPGEGDLRIGIRLSDPSSSFKKELLNLPLGGEVIASSLSGEFILPKNQTEKFVFIAGGIGITPFRSIIKNLLDNNTEMDIFLFYSVRNLADAVYMDIFNKAQACGLNTIITLSDIQNIPPNWQGGVGTLTKEMIESKVADYKNRTFYISGSHGMVTSFKKTLAEAGLKKSQIKTDYFPGY